MRTYLDYNSTVPLRSEAKKAMIDAMDFVGNPSSVHLEGRAAKALSKTQGLKSRKPLERLERISYLHLGQPSLLR